jgi:hypothetical protein
MVAIELIFAHLHVYVGFTLLGYALMARSMGRMLSSWALLYWTLAIELFWVGAVVKSVPLLQFFRTWNPQFKLLCAFAVGVAVFELSSARNSIIRMILAAVVGIGLCIWILPTYFTGWVISQAPYVDPATLPDDGQMRDCVWASVVAYRFGWYIYSVAVLAIVSVVLVAYLKWPGLFLSFLLVALFAFLLVVLQASNIIDIVAAWLREALGWQFALPSLGGFGLDELIDIPAWPTENLEWPEALTPVVKYPDWWPVIPEVPAY